MLFSLVVLQCSLLAPAWELLRCYSWAKAVTRLSHPEPVPLGIALLVLYNPPAKLLENPEITNTGSLYLLSEFVFTFRVSRLKTLLLETLWACASCANGPAALFALSLIFGRFFFFSRFFPKTRRSVPGPFSPEDTWAKSHHFINFQGKGLWRCLMNSTQDQDQRSDVLFLEKSPLCVVLWPDGTFQTPLQTGCCNLHIVLLVSITPPHFWFMPLKTRLLLALSVFG